MPCILLAIACGDIEPLPTEAAFRGNTVGEVHVFLDFVQGGFTTVKVFSAARHADGPCLRTHTDPKVGMRENFGTVALKASRVVEVAPGPDAYPRVTMGDGWLAPNSKFSVSAGPGRYAVSGMHAPTAVTIVDFPRIGELSDSYPAAVVDRSKDWAFSWRDGVRGEWVSVEFRTGQTDGPITILDCIFPAESGVGVVPASALADVTVAPTDDIHYVFMRPILRTVAALDGAADREIETRVTGDTAFLASLELK